MPHDRTDLEFDAKAVNDLLKKRSKRRGGRKLEFFTFILDGREGGYLGYISSVRRIDAIRVITEWLGRMIPSLTVEERREMLALFDQENSRD